MSSTSNPINPARFAAALSDLSLASLHAKAAEIRNSILYLRISNTQLEPFADEGDVDCKDAIRENEVVLERMRERVELLRQEVEGRGARWVGWDEDGAVAEQGDGGEVKGNVDGTATELNGHVNGANGEAVAHQAATSHTTNGSTSGRLNDEELARRIREQMDAITDEDEGMHL